LVQAGTADYAAIHFSAVYPVVVTPCGRRGPSAARWGYVTCLRCLAAGPDDPRIKARIVTLMQTAPANDIAPAEPVRDDPVRPAAKGDTALTDYLRHLEEERERIGAEIARAMPKRKLR
jgi:hypothetical protein